MKRVYNSSARVSNLVAGVCRVDFWPSHTKGVKTVPLATLLCPQFYKASTGFSHKYRTNNKIKKREKVGSPLSLFGLTSCCHAHVIQNLQSSLLYEPRSEKTGLRGFRPGPTQTRLYSHRRWLEA